MKYLYFPPPLSTAVNAVWCVFSSVTDLEVWERELKLMGCEHGLSLWCALQENLEAEFTSELRCLKEGWKFSCLLAIHKNVETRGIRSSRVGVAGGGELLMGTETKLKPSKARAEGLT